MKIVNFSKLLLLALALSVSLTACKKGPKGPTPLFKDGRTTVPGGDKPSGPLDSTAPILGADNGPKVTDLPNTTSGTQLASRGGLENYNQDREAFKQDTIHFDFDRYNVKPAEISKAQAVADYLKGQPSNAVLVEGYCDERGTPGYNMALGERRADSVRESLIGMGISADRIHTISYGEDKPVDPGHNEAAWSKNRRGEFILLTPKAGASAEAK